MFVYLTHKIPFLVVLVCSVSCYIQIVYINAGQNDVFSEHSLFILLAALYSTL